ncbi:MAG: DUF504 domain-containing protein [Syntrophobacteraceae bacterium]
MVPIRELLNRIRWDRKFGTGTFLIGYFDHVKQTIIQVPFSTIRFEEGNSFSFRLEDEDGESILIPLHRVRTVVRDGMVIWKRAGPG